MTSNISHGNVRTDLFLIYLLHVDFKKTQIKKIISSTNIKMEYLNQIIHWNIVI